MTFFRLVNRDLLVFGSSSGSLYVFQRLLNKTVYLFNIPNNEGRITCLAFASLLEPMLAIGTAKGSLIITTFTSLDDGTYQNWKVLYCAKNFCTSCINIIKWDSYLDSRIFVCEELGHIYLISKINTLTSLLVPPSPILILKVDSLIHQIDILDHLLVIATLNRTFIYNILNNEISNFGTRSRPNGTFGAIFFINSNDSNGSNKYIYVSRPGSRIWKTDLNGNVLLTHQFKTNIAETPISNFLTDNDHRLLSNKFNQASTFAKFHFLSNAKTKFLLAQSFEPTCAIFIIDLNCSKLIISAGLDNSIQDLICLENEIFILHTVTNDANISRQQMLRLKLIKLEDYSIHLLNVNKAEAGLLFIVKKIEYFRKICQVNENFKQTLKNIWYSFDRADQDKHQKIRSLIDDTISDEPKVSLNVALDNSTDSNREEIVKLNEKTNLVQDNKFDNSENNNNVCVKVAIKPNLIESESYQSFQKLALIENINHLKRKLEKNGLMRKFKCDCGFPKSSSHLYFDPIQAEIQNILENIDGLNFDQKLEICYQCALWTYYCHLLIKCENYSEYLKICIALNDFSLLNDGMFQDYVKTNQNIWFTIFETFNKLNIQKGSFYGSCVNCGKITEKINLNWDHLLRFILKTMNGKQALNLLIKYQHFLPLDSLNPSICLSIIRSHAISLYQSSVTCNKLSQLSAILNIKDKCVKESH